jgi:glutathione S-transferase
VKAKGRECAKECIEYIEGKLERSTHAVGERLTLVDLYLFTFHRWGNMLEFVWEVEGINLWKQ